MIQHKQIGKRPKKDDILNAKKNRVWISPKGKNYQFDWYKVGRRYMFILIYKGQRMQITEADYNRNDIDTLINVIEKELNNNQ